jgi:DNA repair exonuclease SbcCD ATPase subunit
MEIETLTISNFRGISGTFEVNPQTENTVIVGPNGSGKSSVIAAVDFLLTGEIRELSGEGTQSITALQHGPHVDADPESAWVEAEFVENGDRMTVRRSIANRHSPSVEGEDEQFEGKFSFLSDAAERGLHILSRDELLEFITSPAGTRSESIRSLLDLPDIREHRLALGNAADNFEQEANRFERQARAKRDELEDTLGFAEAGDESLLDLVNQQRGVLDADPLDELHEQFDRNIESPSRRVVASPLLRSDGRERVAKLIQWFEEGREEFLELDNEFRKQWHDIEADEEVLNDLERRRLIELGRDSIDSSSEQCPLCWTDWDPDELDAFLSERLERVAELEDSLDALKEKRDAVQQHLTEIRVPAESLREILSDTDRFESEPLDEFIDIISHWEDGLDDNLLSTPPHSDLADEERINLLGPSELNSMLDELESYITDRPVLNEFEEAWETLRSADRTYDEWMAQSRSAAEYRQVADEMRAVHDAFISARDEVLNQIYTDIEERFEHYYTSIHPDESPFELGLEPTETGLDMEVEFRNKGQYPPHALHSEGHQDSMGICLYFALFDWLQEQEELSVMLLDDVVMSVDAEHRRPLADLLSSELAQDYQMFITTHDDLWHRHLRSSGVVNAANSIQFSGWDIDDGPRTLDRPEMEWETIEAELDAGNISIAAHQTRRMAEWFLREACDRIDGKVPFKADSKWTLGDFQDGVISRYGELLGMAKDAANSWGREEQIEKFNELDEQRGVIATRIQEDGAALNPNVHWNEEESEFAHCTPAELELAVEAYKDFYELLWCSECGSCIKVVQDGNSDIGVQCACNAISWNLQSDS